MRMNHQANEPGMPMFIACLAGLIAGSAIGVLVSNEFAFDGRGQAVACLFFAGVGVYSPIYALEWWRRR